MITAKEASKLADSLDISSHVVVISKGIETAAKQGLRELVLQYAPYNSMGAEYASESLKRLRAELISNGYKVEHIPAQSQMDDSTTRITW
ncbi:hypothetical protein [Hafnia phage yong3]|nr:hypothetical protein [Hafnia phage yong3]